MRINYHRMKYILSAIIISTLLIACVDNGGNNNKGASSKTKSVTQDTANFTTIEWIDSLHQDMGAVVDGAQVELSWRFKNTGSKPLIIESASPGCGCTVAEKPEAPIAPGSEGIIKARFNSEGRVGTQNKSIVVMANTKGHPDHSLTFTLDVKPK